MAREVSFVVCVNLDDKSVSIDDGSFTARFSSNEEVWDTELSEWRGFDEDERYADQSEYEYALAILNSSLPKADGN